MAECDLPTDRVTGKGKARSMLKEEGLIKSLLFTCSCKNFFKRSVVTTRPFVCKASNECDIRLFDEMGHKRRTSRCQACRFRACLDQGMNYGGPRAGLRGGRHTRNPPGSGTPAATCAATAGTSSSSTVSAAPLPAVAPMNILGASSLATAAARLLWKHVRS